MKYRKSKNNQSGFTLIELLIAIAVFSIGIMAAFTLALGNWRVDKENYNRVMAADLAREGIELVRYVRDSNWLRIDNNELCGDPAVDFCTWDYYMKNQNDRRFLVDYESFYLTSPIKTLFGTCDNGDSVEDCITACDTAGSEFCRLQYNPDADTEDRFFFHDNSSSDYLSHFKRMISLQAICYDGITEEIDLDEINCVNYPGHEKIGLRVTSIVGWYAFGEEHNVKAVEYLYNWRR